MSPSNNQVGLTSMSLPALAAPLVTPLGGGWSGLSGFIPARAIAPIAANDAAAEAAALGLGRFVPYVGLAIAGYGLYELWKMYPTRTPQIGWAGWTRTSCSGGSEDRFGPGSGCIVSGYVYDGTTSPFPPAGLSSIHAYHILDVDHPAGITRYHVQSSANYTKTAGAQQPTVDMGWTPSPGFSQLLNPRPGIDPAPDPNLVKSNTAPVPTGDPADPPRYDPWWDHRSQPGRIQVSLSVRPDGTTRPVHTSQTPVVRPPMPPRNGEKERKVKSRGPTLFKVLDRISETSEIIDAVYQSLPKDVRKKWDRKGRGLLDQAGQYGISGADWKLQALWYNWHKIDTTQAIKNIIWNEVSDKLYGKAYGVIRDKGGIRSNPSPQMYAPLDEWL